jgi:hypothetical protein
MGGGAGEGEGGVGLTLSGNSKPGLIRFATTSLLETDKELGPLSSLGKPTENAEKTYLISAFSANSAFKRFCCLESALRKDANRAAPCPSKFRFITPVMPQTAAITQVLQSAWRSP